MYLRLLDRCFPECVSERFSFSIKTGLLLFYLGVELSTNLDWAYRLANKVTKANRTLGFLRRNLSNCPEKVKEAAFKKALVYDPSLNTPCSSAWDPYLIKHIKQLERVQRRAALFVKSCYGHETGTVTNLSVNQLNWMIVAGT